MYSTTGTLASVVPNLDSYIASTLIGANEMNQHISWANSYVDNQLKGRTAVPVIATGTVASGLANAEANYAAYSLLKAHFMFKRTDDISLDYVNSFKSAGDDIVQTMYLPASYDTPTKLQSFTGNGTITITTYDQFTYSADWVVSCISAAPVTFQVWNNNKGTMWYYNLSSETAFPSVTTQGYGAELITKEIRIVIATGSTAFALGDTWAFKTYGRTRLKQIQGIRSIPIVRV